MSVQWKPVIGYEGSYEVSNTGQVRSLDRLGTDGRRLRGKLMNPSMDRRHLIVHLRKDGVSKFRKVHHLVLEAFIGPCPPNMEACHYDDDPLNNNLSNLRWDTLSANRLDMVRNGRHHFANKTHCPHNHPYDEENTYYTRTTKGGLARRCRTCRGDKRMQR